MIFEAPNHLPRPVRLREETRRFAYESLHRKYGKDTLKTPSVALDDDAAFRKAQSKIARYDAAVKKIASEAPIRICEGEKISGAATLGLAIQHYVPATVEGRVLCMSVSHLTVDFETVLKHGVNFIRQKAQKAYDTYKGTEKEAFAGSCLNCLGAFEIWHRRYLKALRDLPRYEANYENLRRVPFKPATNFYEAVQSLWFTFAFIRLCGNWPGIGRIDVLLGDYLKNDLRKGAITLDEAREILAHFFIKGCEWINGQYIGSGDAQHYQNIVLGGIDENGNDVTNEVTYLVLDILEETGISDFPTSVRLSSRTDERLLRRVAEVMRYGGGTLAVYGEDLVIEALKKDGYDEAEARRFANDGCWEVQVPGKTFFTYYPFDGLRVLQYDTLPLCGVTIKRPSTPWSEALRDETLLAYGNAAAYPDFEALYRQYIEDLRRRVEIFFSGWHKCVADTACTVVSLFEQGCIERGLSYHEGGPVYNIISPHIGGLADTVNALYAVKKLVYDEKKIGYSELMKVLQSNWKAEEALRQYALNRYEYFGNDNDEVDGLARRLLSDYADICTSFNGRCLYRFPAGVSTFGRQLEWSCKRLASPHGRRAGEVLAANCSPTPGTDRQGATAMIRSYCKIDLSKLATGAALDLKLLPSSVEGADGLEALVSLLRGFVALGGFFMQPDVVDASLLRAAQEKPEDYPTLSVRVSGWNARFVTLDRQWQDMVIEQNEH